MERVWLRTSHITSLCRYHTFFYLPGVTRPTAIREWIENRLYIHPGKFHSRGECNGNACATSLKIFLQIQKNNLTHS